jgi:Fe2+ transport system protein FeoA
MEIPLIQLKTGKKAKIKRLEGGLGFQKKLAVLNIRAGKTIKKIAAQPLGGPVVVEVGNTKVTVGAGMAAGIIVEE